MLLLIVGHRLLYRNVIFRKIHTFLGLFTLPSRILFLLVKAQASYFSTQNQLLAYEALQQEAALCTAPCL